MTSIRRTVAAGLAGGAAFIVSMALTFRLLGFGWHGDGILLTAPQQSAKLIAVWTVLEPLPLVVARPWPIFAALFALCVGHAFLYRWLRDAWPRSVCARACRFALLIFVLGYVFWELFTLVNQFSEPLALVALELVFWAVIALAEAFTIAAVMDTGNSQSR